MKTINVIFAAVILILVLNLMNTLQPPLPKTVTATAEGIVLTLPDIANVKDGLQFTTIGHEDAFVDAGNRLYAVRRGEKYTFTAYHPSVVGKLFGKTAKWSAEKP